MKMCGIRVYGENKEWVVCFGKSFFGIFNEV